MSILPIKLVAQTGTTPRSGASRGVGGPWDLIVDQSTCDLFRRYLTGQYMGSLEEKEILMDENTVVHRFALLEFNKIIEDPFFLDLHVKADVESCKMETFNGIKYLDLHSLSADLLIVHKYREMQVPRVESSAREVVAEIDAILNYFKLSFHVTGNLSLKSLLVPILSSDVYHKFYQALDRQKSQDHSCSRLRVILKLLQTGVVDPNFHIEEFLRSNMAETVNLGAEITETPVSS
jgi:hypothetical protein